MTPLKAHFLFLLLIFTILSCNSLDEESPNWSKIDLDTSSDLSAITVCEDGSIHIVGGDLWYNGTYVFSPFGESWTVDSILNKQLLAIDQDQSGNLYATGIDGYRLNKQCDDPWQTEQPFKWEIMRDLDFISKGEGIMVGGEALIIGFMVKISDGEIFEIRDWDRELSSITYVTDETYILTGYGFVSKSIDNGKTWIQNEIGGDFFIDCSFPTEKIGYVIGRSGTIIKTIDQGASWETIRNAYNITVSNLPFSAVYFLDENIGYICGDEGLVLVTRDGGESWKKFDGLPNIDLLDIKVKDDFIFTCGKEGTLLKISE